MTDFAYALSSFERQRGGFPALPIINMLAEPVPTEPGTALQSRPGLENSTLSVGAYPVVGLFKADGVLNNGLFSVSNSELYQNTVLVGAIDGTGPVSFAGYSDYVFVNAGQSIWKYNGTTLSSISFPDGADVIKVVVGASRLIAIRASTGKFYWTSPLGVAIDPLAFATAENSPDTLKDMLYLGDRLILFGAETIEFWPATSDPNLPFTPLIGAVLPVGIKGTGMATHFSRTFAWITNFNEVCIGDPDNIVSEPELQIRIQDSTSASLWRFYIDNNEFLAVSLDTETWIYSARTKVWSKFESYGQTNWLCQCYADGHFGTRSNGTLAQWGTGYTDFGGVLERRFRAWTPLTENSLRLANVILRTNPGTTTNLTGTYSNPTVELRTSRDGGYTWQPWKARVMGTQGNYRLKTLWSSLGQFTYPGALVEIRLTDPVPFRISGLSYNEPFGAE